MKQEMNIYVPSRSRFERSLTLEALAPAGEKAAWDRDRMFLAVPSAQAKQYEPMAKRHGVKILPCAKNGIAATRQICGMHAGRKLIMVDDDLRFFYRPKFLPDTQEDNDKARLFKAELWRVALMLDDVQESLDDYAHVAVSAREGNNHLPWPYTECNRPLRVLAYRRKEFLSCEHGRVAIMEDFDVTLQLLKRGYKNKILTQYAQDQVTTQMAGGCSDYRTHELHEQNVLKMVKMHAPFVVPRQKENKGGGEFGKRTEATIHWKKAWASAQAEWS